MSWLLRTSTKERKKGSSLCSETHKTSHVAVCPALKQTLNSLTETLPTAALPPHLWERRNPLHTPQQQNSHYDPGLMVPFILVPNQLCTLGNVFYSWSVVSALGRRRELWEGLERRHLLKVAARGSHGIRAHHKGRRGEKGWTGGALSAPSDPQLRCHLEDGLLDPEGGQQNWCRTLSSLPRKGRVGQERRETEEENHREQH